MTIRLCFVVLRKDHYMKLENVRLLSGGQADTQAPSRSFGNA